jgi:DNA-binding FadR family transcriptional regulator
VPAASCRVNRPFTIIGYIILWGEAKLADEASARSERTVAISPVSSSAINPNQSQGDDAWQQFQQLVSAVNSGDLTTAQQAYTDFTNGPGAKVAQANPDSPIAQALNQIGQALQSGDASGAQKALAALRPHGHGGHHHRTSSTQGGTQAGASAAQSSSAADPNAPGATLDVTA